MKTLPQAPLPASPPAAERPVLRPLVFAPGAFDATLATANRWSFGAKFKNPFADVQLLVDQQDRVAAGTLTVRGERRELHAQEIVACNSQREAELRLSVWQLSRRQSEDAPWQARASAAASLGPMAAQGPRRTSWPQLEPGRLSPARVLPPGYASATPVPVLPEFVEPAAQQRG